MLAQTIKIIEDQYRNDSKRSRYYKRANLANFRSTTNFEYEAKFYLEIAKYNYQKALDAFKTDIKFQFDDELDKSRRSSKVKRKRCEIF